VKHIKDVLHEMYDDDGVEKQADWLVTYKIDSIRLGRMCEKFPALQKSWSDFKMVYELCRSQDDIDRQDP
jgi:aryl carrier-like protein